MKLDVLVFASHPDDAELNCGGTIASLTSRGKKVGIIDLTKGELGTRGSEQIRAEEVKKASKLLKLSYRKNLDLGDSIIHNTPENQLKIIEQVRFTQPHICITGAPDDRHPDHGKGTKLVIDSLFYSGLKKIKSSINDIDDQTAHRPSHILQYMQDRPFDPDLVHDISSSWIQKKEAMLAFSTQFNVKEPGDEPETYISSENYFKQLEARARYFGHLAGFEFGEPFKYYPSPMPMNDLSLFFDQETKR